VIDSERHWSRVGIFSRGVRRLQGLASILGADDIAFRPGRSAARKLDAVVGWGHKRTAREARDYARRHRLPYLGLEDGFLRSVSGGSRQAPLSMVLDDAGIYYDARQPSRLENLLAHEGSADPLDDPALLARARACRARIVEAEISKTNDSPFGVPAGLDGVVLVVDQTRGDASIEQGLASSKTFDSMLDEARRAHAGAPVVVKLHPEVAAGRKRGVLAERARGAGVRLLAEPVNPIALVKRARHVHVVSSQLGFEALMAGVPVTCHGAPFYSGWGLSDDRLSVARRGRQRSLDQLVAAALLLYPRYLHPISGERCEAEEVIEHLALQREMFAKNDRRFFCFGFSRWKRPFVRRHLSGPRSRVTFTRSARAVRAAGAGGDAALVVWGSRRVPGLDELAEELQLPIWRMEDGFLRSVRLGSELTPPGSLVLDSRGIYYDPNAPSELEALLSEQPCSPEEATRAARLRRLIVESGISKYNMALSRELRVGARPGQKVLLVPGQVEDDASIRRGSPVVRTNEALLSAVRTERPDDYILYKPHPDVVIGNRRGHLARGPWDELVEDAPVAACLALADEIHTMTSLVGFEALLREIPVVTWGQPFYAGWGLTEDRYPPERRGRRLTIDELVHAALIRYPRYYSFRARAFCSPEDFVAELIELRRARSGWLDRAPWAVRRIHSLAVSAREWLVA
jgi:capsular polysaccharide export protein